MQKKERNKMIGGDDKPEVKNKSVEEYHFAGGGKYYPQTIKAVSREEAETEYEKTKVEVSN